MKRTRLIAVLVGLAAAAALPQDAFARNRMYNAAAGRFMQRDPAGTEVAPPLSRTLSGSQYTHRDPIRQYADGMSLYQYVGSSPVGHVDWDGAAAASTSRPATQPSAGDVKPGEPGYFPYTIVGPTGYDGTRYSKSELSPELSPQPGLGTKPAGTKIPDSSDPQQNCLGAACGLPNQVKWVGAGADMDVNNLRVAVQSVPKGCRRVECNGVSYSRTRCKAPDCFELIVWIWYKHAATSTAEKPRFVVDYHAVARDTSGGLPKAWTSKQDVGPKYTDITDAEAHWNEVYGPVFKERFEGKPGTGKIQNCFCCDASRMKLEKAQ